MEKYRFGTKYQIKESFYFSFPDPPPTPLILHPAPIENQTIVRSRPADRHESSLSVVPFLKYPTNKELLSINLIPDNIELWLQGRFFDFKPFCLYDNFEIVWISL
jgi:hypothetical protein